MTFIYCLACEDTIWYVGQTTNPKERERLHRKTNDKGCGSDLIPKDVIWKFIILEEVDEDDAVDAERFYYEWFQPSVNKKYPGRSKKECDALYRREHRQQLDTYNAKWNKENADRRREICRRCREKRKHTKNVASIQNGFTQGHEGRTTGASQGTRETGVSS
jgi:predicted GIY-YIG superfamily endonuclease